MQPVVLFDLDGTVLTFDGTPPGPGRLAMAATTLELFGEDYNAGVRFAGQTDRSLARTLMRRAGVSDDEIDGRTDAFLACYVQHLERVLQTRRYRPIGDVIGCLRACRARGYRVGLATGNQREGARLKLRSAGLEQAFDLAFGGYGCDHELRHEVVRAAIRRCRGLAAGSAVDPHAVVVVGDTILDVQAARAVGAHMVGVSIDEESSAELRAEGIAPIAERCGPELAELIAGTLAQATIASREPTGATRAWQADS